MTVFTSEVVGDAVEAAGLGVLPDLALERLAIYGNLLVKWNSRMNLTAIRDPLGILQRHLVESIAASRALPASVKNLLDFGSGAGLPGIPIAICRLEIEVTLAESQSKKAAFLAEVARSIGVNIRIHAGRVEALPMAARFDVVALRAVDRMIEAIGEARGRVAVGGALLLFATPGTRDSLVAAAEPIACHEQAISVHSSVLFCKL